MVVPCGFEAAASRKSSIFARHLVMAAGAGQQRLLFSSAEKLVIVRFANADMPRLVMAGEYDQLDLTFKDEEFFNKLLEPARDGKEVDRSPQKK